MRRLRFTPFVSVSWHVALVVAACLLVARLIVWTARLCSRVLVGAVRYGIAAVRLIAALVRRYWASRQLSQSGTVAAIAPTQPQPMSTLWV